MTLVDPRNGEAWDLPPCPGARVYVIASTPRSGSTLLARMLWGAGGVGAPSEYLNPMQIRDWEVRFGGPVSRAAHGLLTGPLVNLAGRGRWSDARLEGHLRRVRLRRSSGGWFGLKVHWHHWERWFVRAGRDPDRWLGDVRWIRVDRRDRVAQAVSWVRALQTGAWIRDQRARLPPIYDRRAIAGRITELEAAEAGWDAVIGGRPCVRIAYEDLAASPVRFARDVLASLGCDREVGPPDLTPQADALSAEWIARYHAGA